jgi:HK97 family phage portal protein
VGLFTANRIRVNAPANVEANVQPYTPANFYAMGVPVDNTNFTYVTKAQALTIPALARAHNIIAGTIGSLPIEEYDDQDREVPNPRTLITQPDPAITRANTISSLVSDLIFYGAAYGQIMEVDALGYPVHIRRIDPLRITFNTNDIGTLVVSYNLDTGLLPNQGVNSLIVFNSMDAEGVLMRGGRTIKTAIELEAASYRMASEPVPTMILTNDGYNLDAEQKTDLLAAFKRARRDRSTAYVEGPIKMDVVGFDSAQMQLVEARQYQCGNEIARLMGIPAWYVNAENASATYSNVTATRRELLDFGLRNYLVVIEDRLSMSDVTPPNRRVRFDLDDFLRGNPDEQTALAVDLLGACIIDVDEARDLVDYAPSTPMGVTNNDNA